MARVPYATPKRRPLTDEEARRLRLALADSERREGAATRAAAVPGAAVTVVLWALTLLASDAPLPFVTAFWIVFGLGLVLWVRRSLRRDLEGVAEGPRSALRRLEAEEYRVDASAYAEFEEVEDEGAAYAFQTAPDRLLFLHGQEFYPTDTFPALRFALVYPLTEAGTPAEMWIDTESPPATPERVLPGALKLAVDDFPETLQILAGTIDDIESALEARGGP
jgi:hypothetical protein